MPRRLDPRVIRPGDRVRVVTPKFVVRVGYPKSIEDYRADVREKFKDQLRVIFDPRKNPITGELRYPSVTRERTYDKVERELAYMLAKEDGFGGPERSLHFEERPDMAGKEYYVSDLRTVYTGRYYPPSGGYSYWGDYDYEPGGLSGSKAHRLASLQVFCFKRIGSRDPEIPTYFLEKIQDTDSGTLAPTTLQQRARS